VYIVLFTKCYFKRTTSRGRRWVGHIMFRKEMKNGYKTSFRKPEVDKPLQKLWCTWEDNTNVLGVRLWTVFILLLTKSSGRLM
jgi:hypothetical protein